MFQTYLKIALWNYGRTRPILFINIVGLALGMARAALLILNIQNRTRGCSRYTALFIALFTISFQSVKAAMANPVKNLRTEKFINLMNIKIKFSSLTFTLCVSIFASFFYWLPALLQLPNRQKNIFKSPWLPLGHGTSCIVFIILLTVPVIIPGKRIFF